MRIDKTTWRRITQRVIIAAFIVCATCPQAPTPKSSSPDIQTLKDRLQRLEQEMQELKGEIDAVEQTQSTPLAAAAAALRTPPVPPTENPKASTEQERSESTIDLNGFIMTDTGYDFGQINPQWFDVERPTQLPSYPISTGKRERILRRPADPIWRENVDTNGAG
jgi:hypothetical protein